MQEVKLHGAFRSGTNHVHTLLEVNFHVEVVTTDGGWKHAPVPATFTRDPGWPIIGVVREPWVWLIALWGYAQGRGARHIRGGDSWRTFLASPLTITHGGNDAVPDYRFGCPVDYWNSMAANLLSLGARGHVLRHEDALRDPERCCRSAAEALDLKRADGPFVRVDRRTRNLTDRPRAGLDDYVTELPFDPEAELARDPRPSFDRRARRTVRGQLDTGLLVELGYPPDPWSA